MAAFASRRTNQPKHRASYRAATTIFAISNCAQILLSSSIRTGCCSSPAKERPQPRSISPASMIHAVTELSLRFCSKQALTLTDEILDLHDRFVGSIFNKARRRRDEAFQSSGKAINEKVRLYARIGQALLAAKEDGADPFAAIEKEYRVSGTRRCRLTCPWHHYRR